ncbi:hypothetical protein, partial [Frateuria sp. Soil773]|uniref:hypothetical protein n=1 Tax=Frateuria sp. Soil773 TaxID=1736407 RepID=UPI00138F5282
SSASALAETRVSAPWLRSASGAVLGLHLQRPLAGRQGQPHAVGPLRPGQPAERLAAVQPQP